MQAKLWYMGRKSLIIYKETQRETIYVMLEEKNVPLDQQILLVWYCFINFDRINVVQLKVTYQESWGNFIILY